MGGGWWGGAGLVPQPNLCGFGQPKAAAGRWRGGLPGGFLALAVLSPLLAGFALSKGFLCKTPQLSPAPPTHTVCHPLALTWCLTPAAVVFMFWKCQQASRARSRPRFSSTLQFVRPELFTSSVRLTGAHPEANKTQIRSES